MREKLPISFQQEIFTSSRRFNTPRWKMAAGEKKTYTVGEATHENRIDDKNNVFVDVIDLNH